MRNTYTDNVGEVRNINTYMIGNSISYLQDPYLPCRFFGETFTIKTPVIDNHFMYELNSNGGLDNVDVPIATTIKMYHIDCTGAESVVDIRNIYSIGQTLYFQSQEEHNAVSPQLYYHSQNIQDWIFTISEIRQNVDSDWVMVVDSLNHLTALTDYLTDTAPTRTTAKVSICSMPYRCCLSESVAGNYAHTSLSTIIYALTSEVNGFDADKSNIK